MSVRVVETYWKNYDLSYGSFKVQDQATSFALKGGEG